MAVSWSDLAQSNGLVSTQVRGGKLKICHPFVFSRVTDSELVGTQVQKGENRTICGLSMLLGSLWSWQLKHLKRQDQPLGGSNLATLLQLDAGHGVPILALKVELLIECHGLCLTSVGHWGRQWSVKGSLWCIFKSYAHPHVHPPCPPV